MKKTMIVGLVVIFTAPILLSIYLNSKWSDFEPQATRNHGRLVHPVVPASESILGRLSPRQTPDQWYLVCIRSCDAWSPRFAALNTAMGRDADRLATRVLEPELDAADVVSSGLAETETLAIIDPDDYVVMAYPSDADPTGIRKDMALLLKYSRPE